MLNFGGILKIMVGAYIERVGGNYVVQNSMVVWVFEVFPNLIVPFLLNKFGR